MVHGILSCRERPVTLQEVSKSPLFLESQPQETSAQMNRKKTVPSNRSRESNRKTRIEKCQGIRDHPISCFECDSVPLEWTVRQVTSRIQMPSAFPSFIHQFLNIRTVVWETIPSKTLKSDPRVTPQFESRAILDLLPQDIFLQRVVWSIKCL